MLGQEIPQDSSLLDEEVAEITLKTALIMDNELDIDPDRKLYMMTWSPCKDEIPDADFNTQHLYCMTAISNFLKCCLCGCFCVESTQLGIPHYHGWYQVSDEPLRERTRLVHIKVLQRFGNVKITKSLGHMKIFSWSDKANCLWYYKKDLLQAMFTICSNPITKETDCDIDWNRHMTLFPKKGRDTIADVEDRINLRDFYTQFYSDSL